MHETWYPEHRPQTGRFWPMLLSRSGGRGARPTPPLMAALLDDTVAIVLAGGAGERLHPLTKERPKPGFFFGGPSPITVFALSNSTTPALPRVFTATQ